MMEDDLLREFISLVGPALEEEDRIVLGRTLIRGNARGILNLMNERYYQHICWKAAMTRWEAHIERSTYDLSLHSSDDEKEPFAVFEMKRYMSATGVKEIAEIKKDIAKLRARTGGAGFMIVFAANPSSRELEADRTDLEKGIFETMPAPPHEMYEFNTLYKGEPSRFWVIGWPIAASTGVGV